MQRKTLAALAFLLVAGVAAAWSLTRDDPRVARPAAAGGPLPAIDAAAVDELHIVAPAGKADVTLARRDGAWRVTAPVDDAADGGAVDRLLEQLAGARADATPAARSRESWPKLQAGDDQVAVLTVRAGGAELVTLRLGPTGYARVGDGDAVYKVRGLSFHALDKQTKDWRDRAILSFDPKTVTKVSATEDGATVVAERREEDVDGAKRDVYALVDGQQAIGGALDEIAPRQIVQSMQALRATDFADGVDRAAAGLAPARLVLRVTAGDQEHVLEVGAASEAGTYVSVPGSERVWLLADNVTQQFVRGPVEWRDKTIAEVAPADVTEIEVTHEGGERLHLVRGKDGSWTARAPKGLELDPSKVTPVASALQKLRGQRFATAPKSTKPLAIVTYTAGKRKVKLTVHELADRMYTVTANTRPEVFLVPEYAIAPMLRKGSELAK